MLPRLTYHICLISLGVVFCDRLKLSSWGRINELLEQWHIPLLSTPYNEAFEVLIDKLVFLFCNNEWREDILTALVLTSDTYFFGD